MRTARHVSWIRTFGISQNISGEKRRSEKRRSEKRRSEKRRSEKRRSEKRRSEKRRSEPALVSSTGKQPKSQKLLLNIKRCYLKERKPLQS